MGSRVAGEDDVLRVTVMDDRGETHAVTLRRGDGDGDDAKTFVGPATLECPMTGEWTLLLTAADGARLGTASVPVHVAARGEGYALGPDGVAVRYVQNRHVSWADFDEPYATHARLTIDSVTLP